MHLEFSDDFSSDFSLELREKEIKLNKWLSWENTTTFRTRTEMEFRVKVDDGYDFNIFILFEISAYQYDLQYTSENLNLKRQCIQ